MPSKTLNTHKKAWVISVDMGYGHQRAAYPLHDIAYNGVISMNDYPGLPQEERTVWERNREGYEWLSRVQAHSPIGHAFFELFDRVQEIPKFYPRRDLSRPNAQLFQIYYMIKRQGIGKHLFTHVLSKNPRFPLVTTFFIAAFAAEHYGYEGTIYLQICDADVSRTWVPKDPRRSRICYLAPNKRVVERLKLYGVKQENIFFTGFPLPKENIGGPTLRIVKKDLGARIVNLDPKKLTRHKFGHIINYHMGARYIPPKPTHPLTLTFVVGGAGAQSDIGARILESLKGKIATRTLVLNLVAGTRKEVADIFHSAIKDVGLATYAGKGVSVLYEKTKHAYFKKFNALLRTTDVLWTKPSELSFYSALGIPIIMAPTIGSQEDFNRVWLRTIGAGIMQDDPRFTDEWLFDWIESGWLARAALNGFVEAPLMGTYSIEKLIARGDHVHAGLEIESPLAV